MDNEDQTLQDILNYLRGQAANGIAREIDHAVRKAREDENGRRMYMTLLEKYEEMKREGLKEGLEEG
ncbi:MAG: hypothetical protein ACI4ET_00245 [Bilifractor sp.]